MKKTILLLGVVLSTLMSVQCASNAQNAFPLLTQKSQKTIITDLSTALNDMAQASRPVGGDSETYWAASVVDSLHKVVTGKERPFLEQIATIHRMNSYFAYGMNYFPSVIGLYSCPEEAGYVRHSGSVCDSLFNKVVVEHNDIMALADLSAHSYFYTQLYITMLHKINGHEDFEDRDLGYPLQNLGLLRYAKERGVFSEEDICKMYFVFDAVCFFKTYYGLVMSFTYSEEQHNSMHSTLIDHAKYIDAISAPVFEAAYSEEYKGINITDAEFEEIMLKITDIKVDIMKRLADEFIIGSSTQQ